MKGKDAKCFGFFCYLPGKSLYVDRLFKKFQRKDPNAKSTKIRLMEPHINTDSVIKDLAEQLEPLREQDPVLLHVDAAGVSMQALSAGRLLRRSAVPERSEPDKRNCFSFILKDSPGTGGVLVPSANSGLFE